MQEKIGIIGCGRVGITLATHLKAAGCTLCGMADTVPKAQDTARNITKIPSMDALPLSLAADILFITTPDDGIAPVAEATALSGGFFPKQTVFHMSGSLPSTCLAPAAEKGAFTGSLHPLQSFAGPTTETNPFTGIIMAVEGMPEAVETGLFIAKTLGARGLPIRTDAKVLYHAAAVVASNYLVTLMDFAFDLLDASGIEAKDAMDVLGPLVEGTLSNLRQSPPEKALTGPVIRGDVATVSRHLSALHEKCPQRVALYQELGRFTLAMAEKQPDFPQKARQALSAAFNRRETP